jgi:CRISPR-associated protein Csb1
MYAMRLPQSIRKVGKKQVSLLEAGHRAGDAIVRCSVLQEELRRAFNAVQRGDAEPLAKIAPTSMVFGAWDSRDTQAKLPRLIASTIRAFDVRKLTRSAQFVPATQYVADGLLEEPTDKETKDAYAERGFVHVPASGSHGGVIAEGGIRRDASLHLAALRLLAAGENEPRTLALRRYILGLALTAFTYSTSGYLPQGGNLVLNLDKTRDFKEVHGDGMRKDATLTHSDALAYAQAAASAFGLNPERAIDLTVPPDREVEFDRDLAKKDVSGEAGDGDKGTKKRASKKGGKAL